MSNNLNDFFVFEKRENGTKKIFGIVMIVGICLFLANIFISNYLCIVFGGLFIIIGAAMMLIIKDEYGYKMSANEYDNAVNEMISHLGTNPREYVGLDSSEIEDIDPISFEGYKFIGAGKVRKDDTDGLWRSDLYEKATIFFTGNEVHIYKVFLNILSGKTTEASDVLFYDDIVSISTKNEIEKVGKESIEYISINLVSKGGNNMSIAIKGNEDRQKSINAMRALIKEKKTQQ